MRSVESEGTASHRDERAERRALAGAALVALGPAFIAISGYYSGGLNLTGGCVEGAVYESAQEVLQGRARIEVLLDVEFAAGPAEPGDRQDRRHRPGCYSGSLGAARAPSAIKGHSCSGTRER